MYLRVCTCICVYICMCELYMGGAALMCMCTEVAHYMDECMSLCLQVKANESEGLIKQLNDTIDDLNSKMEVVKKENEERKLSLERKQQQCSELAVSKGFAIVIFILLRILEYPV